MRHPLNLLQLLVLGQARGVVHGVAVVAHLAQVASAQVALQPAFWSRAAPAAGTWPRWRRAAHRAFLCFGLLIGEASVGRLSTVGPSIVEVSAAAYSFELMHTPTPLGSEHCIYFQAFLTSPELSDFLLGNRYERVRGKLPLLKRVRVIVQGNATAKPHHITTLACLLEEYRQADIDIAFEDAGSMIYLYLEEIGFFARWQPDFRFSLESLALPTNSTSFVLWQIQRETLDTYISSAYQHYANFFQGKDLSFLTTYLAELFNNALDHAFAGEATERIAFGFCSIIRAVSGYSSRFLISVWVSQPQSINFCVKKVRRL